MTPASEYDAQAVQHAIATFFSRQRPGHWPVAMSESMNAIRRFNPNIDISDHELSGMVAVYAILHGHNLYFDGQHPPRPQ